MAKVGQNLKKAKCVFATDLTLFTRLFVFVTLFGVFFSVFWGFSRPRGRKTRKTSRNTETNSKMNFIFGRRKPTSFAYSIVWKNNSGKFQKIRKIPKNGRAPRASRAAHAHFWNFPGIFWNYPAGFFLYNTLSLAEHNISDSR